MNSPRFSPIDPISRYSEILFGLLMVLTFTGCFNAFEAGRAEVRDLLIAGIGCNIAWGIIDAIVYLITTLTERGRALRLLQQLRLLTPGDERGITALRDALPGPLAAICRDPELSDWQVRLQQHPELGQGASGAGMTCSTAWGSSSWCSSPPSPCCCPSSSCRTPFRPCAYHTPSPC